MRDYIWMDTFDKQQIVPIQVSYMVRLRDFYRVILVVSDWVMLTQFRLRITSK